MPEYLLEVSIVRHVIVEADSVEEAIDDFENNIDLQGELLDRAEFEITGCSVDIDGKEVPVPFKK